MQIESILQTDAKSRLNWAVTQSYVNMRISTKAWRRFHLFVSWHDLNCSQISTWNLAHQIAFLCIALWVSVTRTVSRFWANSLNSKKRAYGKIRCNLGTPKNEYFLATNTLLNQLGSVLPFVRFCWQPWISNLKDLRNNFSSNFFTVCFKTHFFRSKWSA